MTENSRALIPREVLFGNPDRRKPQISPDGQYLTYLAPDARNVMQIWMRTLNDERQSPDTMVTGVSQRSITEYWWTYSPGKIIYQHDVGGNEKWHLFLVDIATMETRDLTPFENVQSRVLYMNPTCADQLLVAMNLEDIRKHDIYLIDLNTGDYSKRASNPGAGYWWMANHSMQAEAVTTGRDDGGCMLLVRGTKQDEWQTLWELPSGEEALPIGTAANQENTIYVATNKDSDTMRLVKVDTKTKQETVLAEDPRFDLSDEFLIDTASGAIQAIAFYGERLTWNVLDRTIANDFEYLLKEANERNSELRIASRDLDNRIWIVSFQPDNGPTSYSLYRSSTNRPQLEELFTSQPALQTLASLLAKMSPITVQSRDGLTMHGYLSLPVGLPPSDLPAVLCVHGGPQSRDKWGYDKRAQWLANRGYAVLQINYRGSSGYGKKFLNAGNHEWGGKMQNDLTDAINWLIAQGIADPKRIGIFGGSYGGYAALAALTFTPEVFACAVDICGPSDLEAMLRSFPPQWSVYKGDLTRRIGDPDRDKEELRSKSPIYFVDRITKPLLIAQGKNDPRVVESASSHMVAAMRSQGKDVTYVLYPDEGHGFVRPQNNMQFYAIAEAFLAKHLGGNCEPMTDTPGASGVII